MKFVCEQNDLNTNLSLVSRAVPSRPTHPVLANVLLSADENLQRVSLTAFDLSLGIKTSFAAQVENSGTLTLPAKLLNDIVSRLSNGEITIDDDAGEFVATITSSFGRYQVRGMEAEEFPELPAIEDGQTIYLAPDTLIEGLHGTLFATSADETKQVLTGVHLTGKKDGLEFAATDGHRLAMVETVHQPPEDGAHDDEQLESEIELNVTVPARALREVERILGMRQSQSTDQSAKPVNLRFDSSQVVFEWGDQRLTTRLLEGQYPAYRQLLPNSFIRSITLDRKQFLSAIERISVLTDQKNNIFKANLDSVNQKLTLSVEAKDVGSGQESIPIQFITGEDIDIAFNVKYLMESLKNLNTQEVQMDLNNGLSPVVLKPLGGSKATHLIMPVQLR
ncbi:DNA polymerase III subunit beta [Argonema galeatum]|uniref:DNA polymerase III subunit beta n=1 Tax=Argonema galeatum TaxID=2942762 RepID=UPI002010FC5A|nr:DNA polymerase III subunit beta [Argonema galeatum]MCL1464658.1 DNA polymerase III subunit beta [Argonema galeatum A003/A1]